MSPRLARRVALGALAAALGAVLLIVLTGGDGDHRVQAEFRNARGLLVGNEVRVRGAPAGSVEKIELTDRGTALVTLKLHEGLEPARADAVAAIRPVDLLGDIYVSLSPGRSSRPLDGPIPMAQTSNRPRLSQLLSAFRSPQRAGLQALLVELGRGLERRGVDVNRAAVELRPALAAADRLMREVGSQNTDLRRLVTDAQRATRQVARRERDLRRMVDGFAGTLRSTSARPAALDAGLERAPATLAQLVHTAVRLERAARELRPLSASLRDAAPGLATATERLRPFLTRATPAADDLRPVVRSLNRVLRASVPTMPELRRGLESLRAAAPSTRGATDILAAAAPAISEGFFVNFPDEATELGKGDYPDAPQRHYWRGAGVVSCEAFGVPVEPGCMYRAFTAFVPGDIPPIFSPPPRRVSSTRRHAAPRAKRHTAPATGRGADTRLLDYLMKP